ncbi:acyl-CoA dehydrogenase family protein [uncultured Abyssibacter sp.]|uniref:acyl-CoA dehydrogenase family protein n=1 Tax=uncultured Abyssibacter sp. TaxID=2320202 RepID=UPI0032B1251B
MSELLTELTDSTRSVLDSLGPGTAEETIWTQVVDLGWLLAGVPESLDGLGLGPAAVCVIQQELGRSLSAARYPAATLVIDALVAAGESPLLERLPLLLTEALATAPLVPPDIEISDDGRLSGTVRAVWSVDRASDILVWTNSDVLLVPTSAGALKARPTWDETRRLFDITFTDVNIDSGWRLAQGAAAETLVCRIETLRDFLLAADAIGGATAALESTVNYLTERKQFGRPLALFQALKHRCADLKAHIAAAEALFADTLNQAESGFGQPQAALLAREAKLLATAAYTEAAEEAVQLHGGIGMTAEHPCHLYLKRAQLNEHLGRRRVSDELELATCQFS